jgi:hypothetical protein
MRHPDDYYATPAWTTNLILHMLPTEGIIMEPSAGEGAIVGCLLAAGWPPDMVRAVEIDPDRAAVCAKTGVKTIVGDFLGQDWPGTNCVLMNPPFSRAQEFIEHALHIVQPHHGMVVCLLRLNFLEGQKRAAFHGQYPSDVYVMPRRPSFTGKGTDATGYGWFVWGPGFGNRWFMLDAPGRVAA